MRGLWLLLGNLMPLLSGLVTAPITARALGAVGRGQITQVLLVAAAIQVVTTVGLPWLSRISVATDPRVSRSWARLGLFVAIVAAPLAVLITLMPTASQLDLTSEQALIAAAIFALSGLSAYRGARANSLLAVGRADYFALVLVIGGGVVLLSIIVLALSGSLNLTTLLGAHLVSLFLQLVLVASLGRFADAPHQASGIARPRVRALGQPWLAQSSDFILTRIDVILLSLLGNVGALGVYSIVALIPQALYAVCQSVVQLSYAPARFQAGDRRHTHVAHLCLALGIVASILSIPVILYLFPILFGGSFAAAVEYIPAAAVMCIAAAGLAPAIARGADGAKSIIVLAPLGLSALGGCYAIGVLVSIPFAVLMLGAVMSVSAWSIVISADPRSLAAVRVSETIRWLRGKG